MRKLSNTPIQHFRPVGRNKQKRIFIGIFHPNQYDEKRESQGFKTYYIMRSDP